MANPVPRSSKKAKKSTVSKKLPGEDLTDTEMEKGKCPFSDTEEEVDALAPDHRAIYDKVKKLMKENHNRDCGGILNHCGGGAEELVNDSFQVVVEYLLPGQGKDFAIEVEQFGGAYGRVGKLASTEIAYLVYKPSHAQTGDYMDGCGRGSVNMPWGHQITPMLMVGDEMAKQVDAAFAVIVDKLGLLATGPAGYALITGSSGG